MNTWCRWCGETLAPFLYNPHPRKSEAPATACLNCWEIDWSTTDDVLAARADPNAYD